MYNINSAYVMIIVKMMPRIVTPNMTFMYSENIMMFLFFFLDLEIDSA